MSSPSPNPMEMNMPERRKRFNDNDKPTPCVVRIPIALSPVLYREKRLRGYRDETELVCAIIRKWSEDLDRVDWPKLLAELKADSDAGDDLDDADVA